MIFIFHTIVCIVFVVLQTVIFPMHHVFDSFFDLFIPVIIYLGLFHSLRHSLFILLLFGTVVDSLSGAPFGVYLSCYFWLFAAVYWFKGFLHIHSFTLLSLIVFIGVLIENLILLMAVNVSVSQWDIFSNVTSVMFIQLFTAAIIGPFIIIYIERLYEKANQALGRFREDF